jgi:hypothetical protein
MAFNTQSRDRRCEKIGQAPVIAAEKGPTFREESRPTLQQIFISLLPRNWITVLHIGKT